jgi:hypothetical protein
MRTLQIGIFGLGLLAFLAALVVAGTDLGDILWRAGIALMLADLVVMKLWPATKG